MEKIKIRRRIQGKLTPAQARQLAKARKLIAGELPDLVQRNQMRHDARKEKTFSGVLRRAVHAFPLSPMKVAARAGIPWVDLAGFLTAEKTLPSEAVDRLVRYSSCDFPQASRAVPPRQVDPVGWTDSEDAVSAGSFACKGRNTEGEPMAVRAFTVVYEKAEGGGYYAHVSALDLTTEGRTMKEAKVMARDAIEGFLEAAKILGKRIPGEAKVQQVGSRRRGRLRRTDQLHRPAQQRHDEQWGRQGR